uniref:Putative ovule protein n=1 Tax=Solanum chacoense TaxID=4108 RepID=A0A0V0GXY7_SOLCH
MLLECHLSRNLVDGNKVWKIWLSMNSLVGKNIFFCVSWMGDLSFLQANERTCTYQFFYIDFA